MQDLFQLATLANNAGSTSAAEGTPRKPRPGTLDGSQDETTNFEALLALAALMTSPTAPASPQQPTATGQPAQFAAAATGPRSEPDAAAFQFSLPSQKLLSDGLDAVALPALDGQSNNGQTALEAPDAAADSAVRDLLRHLATQQDQAPQTAGEAPRKTDGGAAARTLPPSPAQDFAPADFKVVRDLSGDHAGLISARELPQTEVDNGEAQAMNPDLPETATATLTEFPRQPESIERGRLLDYSSQWATRQIAADRTGRPASTQRFDDGGLSIPQLRVVARNENPTLAARQTPPDLRLIELDPSADLATRLAGSWEHTFVPGAGTLADEPLLASLPALAVRDESPRDRVFAPLREIETEAPEQGGESDRAVISTDDNARVEQPEEAHFDTQADAGDTAARREETGSDVSGPATTQPTARTSSHDAAVAPVLLFEDFLSVDRTSGTPVDPEPVVAVRQAAVEVANELRHLQRTGGTELAFNLRLHPEHLGQVEIELQRVDNVWSVSIVAANDEARDALASEINRLEHRLRDSNLSLDSVSVVTRSPDEAIAAPSANERASGANTHDTNRHSWNGGEDRDQSGWQNNEAAGIIGIDSRSDADPAQELTSSHRESSDAGIDIKA